MYRKLLLILPVVVLLAAGCGGKQTGVTPFTFQPQVVNQTDNFSFQATSVANVTQTLQYTWQNTGTTANVSPMSEITSGSATVTILDSEGTELHVGPLDANATFVIGSGTAGSWTIRVVLSSVSGPLLNFLVQRGN